MAQEESAFFNDPGEYAAALDITGMEPMKESSAGRFCVYRGKHLGKLVVLKTLSPASASDPVAMAQLRKEFSLGFGVESPRVARTLAWLTLPGTGLPAIEMEFCSGEDLRRLLDSEPTFSDTEIEAIVNGLFEALGHIHRAGVVHRDIKPSNLIFDRQRLGLKVIDFGCADSADSALLKSPAGTARYTPPEKRSGAPTALPADDLYAAGQLLLELASTAEPKMGRRLRRLASALLSGRFATASEAAAAFTRLRAGLMRPVMWLAATFIAIGVGCAALYFQKRPATDDVESPAESPETQHKVDQDESAAAETIESLADYALAAGQLMRRSEMGLTSEAEEVDLAVIHFADSIYHNTMKNSFLGKHFDKEQQRSIAEETAERYAAELSRHPRVSGRISPARQRALLAARTLANLYLYHSPPYTPED